MVNEKVHITKENETYLPTVYGKALDGRSPDPILGDTYAAEALDKIDFDFNKIYVKGSEVSVAIRAKHLDGWAREFLAAHGTATVLHLGCGLDSRIFRIDPPATVRWYDVDMPDVIEIRRKIYPERHDYQMIGSNATDLTWLDQIPGDRPVLVVAEGFMQYLAEKEMIALLTRITGKFPHGDIIFDAYSGLATWTLNRLLSIKKAGVLGWSMGDPHELERQVPRLKLIDAVPFLTLPELVERMSSASRYQKVVGGMMAHFGFYKRMIRHYRYRF